MYVKKNGNIPIETYERRVSPYIYELNKIKKIVKNNKDKQVKFYRNYIMMFIKDKWTCINISKEQYESYIK